MPTLSHRLYDKILKDIVVSIRLCKAMMLPRARLGYPWLPIEHAILENWGQNAELSPVELRICVLSSALVVDKQRHAFRRLGVRAIGKSYIL